MSGSELVKTKLGVKKMLSVFSVCLVSTRGLQKQTAPLSPFEFYIYIKHRPQRRQRVNQNKSIKKQVSVLYKQPD